MKKLILLILIFILNSYLTFSIIIMGDEETTIILVGDEETYFLEQLGDNELNNIFIGEIRTQSCDISSYTENNQKYYSYTCTVTQGITAIGYKEVYSEMLISNLPQYSERGGESYSINVSYNALRLARQTDRLKITANITISEAGYKDFKFIYNWHVQTKSDTKSPSRPSREIIEEKIFELLSGKAGFYDVFVSIEKDKYYRGEEVSAKITLKNTGDFPDKDTILTYYLTDENSEKFGETKEMILEVPPITYNETQCRKSGGIIEEKTLNCITILNRTISLLSDASYGEWRFNVRYETTNQDLIKVYSPFEVVKSRKGVIIFIVILVIALILVVFFIRRREEEEEEEKNIEIEKKNRNV